MMNDRFDAQLREHLLGTADTRPAEGQLSGVLRAVSGTAQRHPLAARLTWFPGRIGPVPTRTFRYALIGVALIAAMVAGALLVGQSPARSTVFEGTWTSTDPGDGSAQSLVVGSGPTPTVQFVDHFASGFACRNDAVKVFTADGTGTITTGRLDVTWPDGGGCGLETATVGPETYTYDDATDTITDSERLTWARARGGEAAPTRRPITEPTAEASTGAQSSACLDLTHGGVYGRRVGPLFVSMTAPNTPLIPWGGDQRDGFDLSASCRSDSPVEIQANIVTSIAADACDPTSGVPVTSYAQAVEALTNQRGHSASEVADHNPLVGGLPSAWFAVRPDSARCTTLSLWNDAGFAGGAALAYLLDADGVTLGILLRFGDSATVEQGDEAETIIYSVQIETGLTPEATDPIALPSCIDFDHEGTYTAMVDAQAVSVTVPASAGAPWSGDRERFELRRATCDGPGMPLIQATFVDHVYADACQWEDGSVATPTPADVVAALQAQTGHDTSAPIATTLGNYPATRLDLALAAGFDRQACDSGDEGIPNLHVWPDVVIALGSIKQVYVVNFHGQALVIDASYFPGETPAAGIQQIDEIVATLDIRS